MRVTWIVLAALAVGLVTGTLSEGRERLAWVVAVADPVGALWVNGIRMTVIPLVVGLLVTGVVSGQRDRLGRLGAHAVLLFVLLLLGGGLFAVFTAPALMGPLVVDPATSDALRAGATSTDVAAQAARVPTVTQRILEVVPANPVRAAVDGAMLPLIVFTLCFALATTRIAETRRLRIAALAQGVAEAALVLVGWVLRLAPIGVLALGVGLGSRMGIAAAGAVGHYIIVLCLVLFGYTLLLYPLTTLLTRIPMRQLVAAALPAQTVAISSRSSLAALPANIAAARDRLALPADSTGFVLPLAVALFRPNVPIAWVTGVLFLGRLYGVEFDVGALIALVVTATAMSFGVPGLPSASLLLLAPVLVSMGLPAEGVGILIAVDVIPDMLKTTANVTSHLVSTVLVTRPASGS